MMKESWGQAIALADRHAESGGPIARLARHGDTLVGAFCGAPYAREVVWQGNRYEEFDPWGQSPRGRRPSLRVLLNFYVPSEGRMRVIEGGTTWFKDILELRKTHEFSDWLFEIKRHGGSGDPRTTYSIVPDQRIDGEVRRGIQGAALHDLVAVAAEEYRVERPPQELEGLPSVPQSLSAEVHLRTPDGTRTDLPGFDREGVQRLNLEGEGNVRRFLHVLANFRRRVLDPFA